MTSEIDKLKHFHVENYSGTNFTNDLNDGEEFLYTTIRCEDDKEVTLLCNIVVLKVIRRSNICKHAIKELKLAGYGKGEGGPVVPLLGKLILFKNYVIGILLVLFDLLMKNDLLVVLV